MSPDQTPQDFAILNEVLQVSLTIRVVICGVPVAPRPRALSVRHFYLRFTGFTAGRASRLCVTALSAELSFVLGEKRSFMLLCRNVVGFRGQ